jgi:hypothetical protein
MTLRYRHPTTVRCRWCSKTFGTLAFDRDEHCYDAEVLAHVQVEHPAELADYLRKLRER